MATQLSTSPTETVVLTNVEGASRVVLVCEHASAHIPATFNHLGLGQADRSSHAVWDPGAGAVAIRLGVALDAKLVAGGVSRLVYDCNRPPEAPDAMPTQSEAITVPGNTGLDAMARMDRVRTYYSPFRAAVARAMEETEAPVLVTVHSFTPVYFGHPRTVEIGVLHDADTRLADAMLAISPDHTSLKVARNQPYGPQDGVTHTLREHALPDGHPNVMLEIRNDLIATPTQQEDMAEMIASWLSAALTRPDLVEQRPCAV